jgi:hypothetical protein
VNSWEESKIIGGMHNDQLFLYQLASTEHMGSYRVYSAVKVQQIGASAAIPRT